MNVGSIGQPRRPPAPKRTELQAALDLLTSLGGGDPKVRKYLADLNAAIIFNEKLLVELNHGLAQLGDLQSRERTVAARETEVATQRAKIDKAMLLFGEYEADLKP